MLKKTLLEFYRKNYQFDATEIDDCCDDQLIERVDGKHTCINCGVVFQREIVNNEKRAYTQADVKKKRRTEMHTSSHIGGRTYIGKRYKNKDGKGKKLKGKKSILFRRLGRIQRSLVDGLERNFWDARPKLNFFCSKLNIPKYIKETAWRIYRRCAKKQFTMGRSIEGFVLASLYTAIRVHEFPRMLDDVVSAGTRSRKEIATALGMIIRGILPELGLVYKPAKPKILIGRIINEMGMSVRSQKIAHALLKKWFKENRRSIQGKDPRGFVGCVVYAAGKITGEKRTQSEVAEAVNVTEVTLRSRLKELKKSVCLYKNL